jgi:hypothetical protein
LRNQKKGTFCSEEIAKRSYGINTPCTTLIFREVFIYAFLSQISNRKPVYLMIIDDWVSALWQYGLWSFQTGGTKLGRFLPNNQQTEWKLLNFENWVNGEVSKVLKFDQNLAFKVKFLCQKLSKSFSIFFSLKNVNLGAHFLLLKFFDNINFKSLYFVK